MNDLYIAIGVLIAIAGGISAIGGAWKYVKELRRPYDTIKDRVEKLERQNEEQKRDLDQLEVKLRAYIDEQNDKTDHIIDHLKEEMSALRVSIESNERDTKLILKDIFYLSNYLSTGDKAKLQELMDINDEILNHLLGDK